MSQKWKKWQKWQKGARKEDNIIKHPSPFLHLLHRGEIQPILKPASRPMDSGSLSSPPSLTAKQCWSMAASRKRGRGEMAPKDRTGKYRKRRERDRIRRGVEAVIEFEATAADAEALIDGGVLGAWDWNNPKKRAEALRRAFNEWRKAHLGARRCPLYPQKRTF